jgi:hypothetical protein
LVNTEQGRIRTLLLGEIDAKMMQQTLIYIDLYITVKRHYKKLINVRGLI